MPECNYCSESYEDEQRLATHLIKSHGWEELSRIDRRRVEKHRPEYTPDAGTNDKIVSHIQRLPGADRVTRRQAIGLTAGAAILGGGYMATGYFGSDELDTSWLSGEWIRGDDLLYQAEYPGVTAYEGELYIFGGADGENTPQSDAFKYNPTDETWTELEPMPVEGQRITATRVDSEVFIIDGRTQEHTFGDGTVRIYDIEDDSWSLGASRPVNTRDAGQTTDGERIYMFGGNFGGESTDVAHAYDPEADSWQELSSLPFPNRQMSCHYIPSKGQIYMFGGESPGGTPERDDVILYDPETDSYDDSPSDMPEPSQTIPSTVYENVVLFPGGEEPGGTTGSRTFRVYDPEADLWGELPSLIEMVEGTDSVVIDDMLFVPGGRTYLEPDTDLDEEPHDSRYDGHPVFLNRMQIYQFDR